MASSTSADTGNACKRLQKELMGLMMSKDEGISAFPDADNILSWTATIDGKIYPYSFDLSHAHASPENDV
jgi:ubiquitin-protein ligase